MPLLPAGVTWIEILPPTPLPVDADARSSAFAPLVLVVPATTPVNLTVWPAGAALSAPPCWKVFAANRLKTVSAAVPFKLFVLAHPSAFCAVQTDPKTPISTDAVLPPPAKIENGPPSEGDPKPGPVVDWIFTTAALAEAPLLTELIIKSVVAAAPLTLL